MTTQRVTAKSTGRVVTAILFDTFGTVVDWRSGITRDIAAFAEARRIPVDPASMATQWRDLYQPALEEIRSGRRPFTTLDVLHLENLRTVLAANGFNLDDIRTAELQELNFSWHRLDPWPDSIEGLTTLRAHYMIGPLSNGNLALLANMAKRAGLPWDVIISADLTRAYKPRPESYTRAAQVLNLHPGEIMLAAAHNSDLTAAREAGLATAFIPRPTEHGSEQATDLTATQAWDISATDLNNLAALCITRQTDGPT